MRVCVAGGGGWGVVVGGPDVERVEGEGGGLGFRVRMKEIRVCALVCWH